MEFIQKISGVTPYAYPLYTTHNMQYCAYFISAQIQASE